jgi:hypothetical protein
MPKIEKHIGQGFARGELETMLDAFLTDITAQKVIIDELHDDHATFKTCVDAVETLIEELHDDHATNKTAIDEGKTVTDELVDDHATFITVVTDIKTLLNDIRNRLAGDGLMSLPELAIGSTVQNVANVAFDYIVNGAKYTKAAVAAGTAPGNDVIPTGTYGAVALDIGADGTIDVIEATDNATGYASAALAIEGLAAVAADHVRMGTVTVIKSDGAFTFGTTSLADASTTVAYTDGTCVFAAIGAAVSTSAPATLTASKATAGAATLTATKPASAPATLTASKTALTVTT